MKKSHWHDIGIDDETRFLSLNFNNISHKLIAEFQRKVTDSCWVHSLYIRGKSDEKYHRLTERSDSVSYHDMVVARDKPYLFCNIIEWSKSGSGAHLCLKRFNLDTENNDATLEFSQLHIPDKYNIGWFSQINNVTDDGNTITCVIALKRKEGEGNRKQIMDYWLATLNFNEKSYDCICLLKHAFL